MEDGISWCVDLLRPATRQHFCAVLPSNERAFRNRFQKGRCDQGCDRQDRSAAYPLSLSHPPSQADFLFGESAAHWLEIGPLLLTATQACRGRQGRATKLGPRPVRRCSTADANITRPRGDARPAKVSTLSMSSVAEAKTAGSRRHRSMRTVFTNIAGLNTFAPAHLVSSVHTTSKVLYAQRLGSSFQAQRRVDWPLYIVPYHSSRQCSNRTYHTGVSPWPVGT